VRIYAGEMAKTALRVNLVDPGIVATKLRLQGFPAEDRAALKTPDEVVEPFVALASAECALNGELLHV